MSPSPALRIIVRSLLVLISALSGLLLFGRGHLSAMHFAGLYTFCLPVLATATLLASLLLRLPLQNVLTITAAGIAFPTSFFLIGSSLDGEMDWTKELFLAGLTVFLLTTAARSVAECCLWPWRTRTGYGWNLAALTIALSSGIIWAGKPATFIHSMPLWLVIVLPLGTHFTTAVWFIDKRRILIPPAHDALWLWFCLLAIWLLILPVRMINIGTLSVLAFNFSMAVMAWHNSTPKNLPR